MNGLSREEKSPKFNRSRPSCRSLETLLSAICFFAGVALLRFQSSFSRCFCGLRRSSLLRNDQRVLHQLGEAFLCQLSITSLAARVTRHDADVTLSCDSRREPLSEPCTLFFAQCRRSKNVPEDFDAR